MGNKLERLRKEVEKLKENISEIQGHSFTEEDIESIEDLLEEIDEVYFK